MLQETACMLYVILLRVGEYMLRSASLPIHVFLPSGLKPVLQIHS